MDYREVLYPAEKFLFSTTSNDQHSMFRLLVDSDSDDSFFCLVYCPGCDVFDSEPGRADAFFTIHDHNSSRWVDYGFVSR